MAKKKRPEKTESGYYRQGTYTKDNGSTGYDRPVRTVKGVLAGAASVDKARENRESRANTLQPKSAKPYISTPKEDAKAAKSNAKRYGDFKDMTPTVRNVPYHSYNEPSNPGLKKEKKGGTISKSITALDQVQRMYSKKKK